MIIPRQALLMICIKPKIESDKLFNQLKKHKKDLKGKKLINLSNCETNLKKGKMDKDKFFHNEPKRINMTDNNKIMENSKSYISYAEANRVEKMFERNKEKNTRNKKLSINLQMDKTS